MLIPEFLFALVNQIQETKQTQWRHLIGFASKSCSVTVLTAKVSLSIVSGRKQTVLDEMLLRKHNETQCRIRFHALKGRCDTLLHGYVRRSARKIRFSRLSKTRCILCHARSMYLV